MFAASFSNLNIIWGVQHHAVSAECVAFLKLGKWFEPRGISYLFGVIVQVKVVFRKTVAGD